MSESDQDTCSLNLRSFSRSLRKKLYERKVRTGKSVCRQLNEIAAAHFEKSTQEVQRGEVQRVRYMIWHLDWPLPPRTRLARRRGRR